MEDSKPLIIGLSGYARSGKDAVAGILDWEHEFDRDAFANALRHALLALDPIVWAEIELDSLDVYHYLDVKRLSEVVEELGWEGIKSSVYADEVRTLQQRMGTEAGRNVHGADLWVDALFRRNWSAERWADRLVVSDVRFENEARAIRDAGGFVVRIDRPGVGPANDHISERGMDGYPFDFRINNDGNLHDLSRKVAEMVAVIEEES